MPLTDEQKATINRLLMRYPHTASRPLLLFDLMAAAPTAVRNEWKAEVQARLAAEKSTQAAPLDAESAALNEVP